MRGTRTAKEATACWLPIAAASLAVIVLGAAAAAKPRAPRPSPIDQELQRALQRAGFTGRVEQTLEQRLGRPLDRELADVGRNSGFLPRLMLNGRFIALSGDPFDNSLGFQVPAPEGLTRFPANDPEIRTLLAAQGHIPQTELVEMAGFTGTAGTIAPQFDAFRRRAGHSGTGARRERLPQ